MIGAEAAIATRALTKRYGHVTAVDRVDLHVQRGEIYALLGLNGAGKTTLIRMLLGLVRPTEGSVTMLGCEVRASATGLWADVGYLVETTSAYPELTVAENLDLVRRLRRIRERNRISDVIQRLALGPYVDRRARDLSLGNAQRLGLAKALIHRPRLLILDEPTNGLDPAGVVEIRDLLRELADQYGVTIFLSSHILTEVARLAARIGVIHSGRLLEELDAENLSTRLRRRLLLSTRDIPAAAAALHAAGHIVEYADPLTLMLADSDAVQRPDNVATALVRAGCAPTRLLVETEDLETYFLRLVGAERSTT